jgi:hypothetical protein
MRHTYKMFVPALGVLALAFTMMPSALAQCGLPTKLVKPANWNPQMSGAHMMLAAQEKTDESAGWRPMIVGMWHVVFTAHTLNGGAIPDTVTDNSVVVWHSDGSEVMNSSRPAQDGNFCLGVWEQTGPTRYYLNHIPWQGNDATNAPSGIGDPEAGAQLTEVVNLTPDGNRYSGTYTLTAYNGSGQRSVQFTGTIEATRINIHTSITSLF